MIRKGFFSETKTEAGAHQKGTVKGLAGDNNQGVELIQQHGFASRPANDDGASAAETILMRVQGQDIAIGSVDKALAPQLEPGEACVYSSKSPTVSHRVYLKIENGNPVILIETDVVSIALNASTNAVTITAESVEINGTTYINGQLYVNGFLMDETHKHSGVQAGSGNTGGVV